MWRPKRHAHINFFQNLVRGIRRQHVKASQARSRKKGHPRMHCDECSENKIQDGGQCERNVIINIIHSIRAALKIAAEMDHYFYVCRPFLLGHEPE